MFQIEAAHEEARKKLPTFRLNSDPNALRKWRTIFMQERTYEYKKKQVLLEQGIYTDSVYYIVEGLVEYTHVDTEGNEKLIEVIGQGSIFNLQPFFGGNVTLGSFVTLVPTRVVPLKKDKLLGLLGDKELAEELLHEMSSIVAGMTRQLWVNAESANTRIEQVLYGLAENRLLFRPEDEHALIDVAQSDLARISRTTRVTVTKALSKLKEMGVVEVQYGGILVKDLDALQNLAKLEES